MTNRRPYQLSTGLVVVAGLKDDLALTAPCVPDSADALGLRGSHEHEGWTMAFEVGKRVVAESESTGRRPRPGVVEEVLRGEPSPRYRIRWDDGRETIYTPASSALRAEPRGTRPKKAPPRKR